MNIEDWFDTAKADRHWEGGSCRIVDRSIEFSVASQRMEFLYRDRMLPGNRYKLRCTQAIQHQWPNTNWGMFMQLHGGLNLSPCLAFDASEFPGQVQIQQRTVPNQQMNALYRGAIVPKVPVQWDIEILVSSEDDGELVIQRDGFEIVNRAGPNIYTESTTLSFKIGIYCGPDDMPRSNRVYEAWQL